MKQILVLFLILIVSIKSNCQYTKLWNANYPGGPELFKKYIVDNCKLSEEDSLIFGQQKVVVNFKVDTTGKVYDIVVKEGRIDFLNKRAVSILSKIPLWEPAIGDGKLVEELRQVVMIFK